MTTTPSLLLPRRASRPGRAAEAIGRAAVLASACAVHLAASSPALAQDPADADVIRAVRAAESPTIDGVLDDAVWRTIEPVTGFRQRWPEDGEPATERTEVRVAYDARAIYVGMIMHDREPARIMRSILHREGRIDKDDRIIIALDTYHDGRSAYIFELNSFGTQGDAHFTDEALRGLGPWQWEGVYESEARVTDRGWELEVAIPLTTIRFQETESATMGIAFYRSIRRKNEEVLWPHIGQEYSSGLPSGIDQVSRYATLTGLENIKPGRHVEVKPFAIAGGQRVAGSDETTVTDDVGLDVKYSLTSGLTLDLTLNTDFAQVEADNVQINLTRFGLFFPEKREFFLERYELFKFGNDRTTEIFHSRRIGIGNDIRGGGRVTGQAGPISIGLLDLQTSDGDAGPGANNGVVRLRADVGPRATVGGIFTNLQNAAGYSRTLGADAEFRFLSSSSFRSWVADGWSKGGVREGTGAGYAALTVRNALISVGAEYFDIGEHFDPALGFVQRRDVVRRGGHAGIAPRFPRSRWARQLSLELNGFVIDGHDGVRQSEDARFNTVLALQTGDMVMVGLTHRAEQIASPFDIRPGVRIPAGDHGFNYMGVLARTDESRTLSANAVSHWGDYWNGTWFQVRGGLTWKTGPHLELRGGWDRRQISLPVENGDFSTTIVTGGVLAALSRKFFANALIQYDNESRTVQANVRFDWIHTPGSDLFLGHEPRHFPGDRGPPSEARLCLGDFCPSRGDNGPPREPQPLRRKVVRIVQVPRRVGLELDASIPRLISGAEHPRQLFVVVCPFHLTPP